MKGNYINTVQKLDGNETTEEKTIKSISLTISNGIPINIEKEQFLSIEKYMIEEILDPYFYITLYTDKIESDFKNLMFYKNDFKENFEVSQIDVVYESDEVETIFSHSDKHIDRAYTILGRDGNWKHTYIEVDTIIKSE